MSDDGKTIQVETLRFTQEGRVTGQVPVCLELPFIISVNGREMFTVLCSPADLDHLVLGILQSESIVNDMTDIESVKIDSDAGRAEVRIRGDVDPNRVLKPLIATGGGKGVTGARHPAPVKNRFTIAPSKIPALMDQFLVSSPVYANTRGVHSAALASRDRILVFKDDIGRHNALDKVFGQCLADGINTSEGLVILSGRISSEMLLKVARRQVPLLLTKAVPTSLGISLADQLGITLVTCSPGKDVTVYAHAWRLE